MARGPVRVRPRRLGIALRAPPRTGKTGVGRLRPEAAPQQPPGGPTAPMTPVSLWDETAEEARPEDALDGDAEADLAIVGGGFTGLSTALHAAEAGLGVVLLEAHGIGHGGSGRNVGLVNAGLWLPPDAVAARLGEDRGERLVAELGAAPDAVFALIERHQIRCEATRAGTIHAAHARRALTQLEARAAAWRRRGAPVEVLDGPEVARRTGSRAFHGGLLDRRAGTINPMGYARGLARAAAAAGARIAVRTPVVGIERRDGRWRLQTPNGTVHAPCAVLATNAYTGGLWPGLARTFTPLRYFQLATEPLGARASHILPGGEGVWDTAPVMTSLRRDRAGRILVGSMGRVRGGTAGLSRRWAERRLARLVPGLGRVRFEAAWHGRLAMTPDHLPRLHRLAEGLWTPIGYNGRGIGPGTVFGRAMAALAAGAGAGEMPLPVTEAAPVPAAGLRAWALGTGLTAHQFLRSV